MITVLLLICSNAFMTLAWYGHLNYKQTNILLVVFVSWMIALPEYALQVPANRWGHGQFTAAQLKIIQEVISISVFVIFSFFYLRETPKWNEVAAFVLIVAAVFVMLYPKLFPAAS